MALTVVGSIAFDSVTTPFGEREKMLGGSAVHFSLAASYFTDVRIVGPVGDDFTETELGLLEDREIDTSDIERVPGGETFYWKGSYGFDLNTANTEETRLNVFGEFEPKLSNDSASADTIFLANIQPSLQRQVRRQCSSASFSALDSMNLWIETARDELVEAISEVECVLVNDAEIRQLTDQPNLARAARAVMEMGPEVVVAKQGEYGAALFTRKSFFALPGFPLEDVRDPTGAGDSFAGGMMGHLAALDRYDPQALKEALAYGVITASFTVEDFSLDRLAGIDRGDLDRRVAEYRQMLTF